MTASRTIARRLLPWTSGAALLLLAGPAAVAAEDAKPPEWLPEGSLGIAFPTLADPGGLRAALWTKGIKYQLNFIGEVLGNTSGGQRRRARPGSRLELVVDADLEKAMGWTGTAFHVNAYRIDGTGTSRYDIGNLMPVSNIEAIHSTRLFEAWLEQSLMDGRIAIRAGQLAADTEFVTSTYAGLFVSGTFGWPTLQASDLPAGGPAYPLATPGVRIALKPTDDLKILLGLYNGNPAGRGPLDPQLANRHGLDFRVTDPALLIGEVQYSYGDAKSPKGLSGTVKLGAWTHFGKFDDQRFDTAGVSLASALSNGNPLQRRSNQGVYGVIDQQVYRMADDPLKGIGIFARAAVAPSDRNLVNFYADAGVNLTGVIGARPDDAFGFAVGYTHVSKAARALDVDFNVANGTTLPVRSSEWLMEATYSAQIVPGWTVQPLVQYIVRPGGGIANAAGNRVANATVIGVRTTLKY